MTTPAAPPQQPVPPPPQQQGDGLDDTALAVAIAALLAQVTVTAAYAASVATILAALKLRFRLSAGTWSALGAVLSMVTKHPGTTSGVIGPASRQVSSMNAARRAQYVTAATRRVLATEREARAKGLSVDAAREQALATEQRYFEMHLAAMANRAKAAGETDKAAARYGNLLGWLAKKDDRTSPECYAASGKNYYASHMPDMGFPGAVHPSCRCRPVASWPGGKLLPSSGLRLARAA